MYTMATDLTCKHVYNVCMYVKWYNYICKMKHAISNSDLIKENYALLRLLHIKVGILGGGCTIMLRIMVWAQKINHKSWAWEKGSVVWQNSPGSSKLMQSRENQKTIFGFFQIRGQCVKLSKEQVLIGSQMRSVDLAKEELLVSSRVNLQLA